MKKVTLFLALLGATLTSFAQIQERSVGISTGSQNGFALELTGAQLKKVYNKWEYFVKKYKGKTKFDKKLNEYFSDNALITEINGNNTVDIYTVFTQEGANTKMAIAFDLGGAYLSSSQHPQAYPAAEKLIYAFAITVSKGMVEEELKSQQKIMIKKDDELKSLVKDKNSFEKDIENLKKKIAQAEKEIEDAKKKIEENLKQQSIKQAEAETQKNVVKDVETRLKSLD